jgi:extracellular elastinolytic metalloproteinase
MVAFTKSFFPLLLANLLANYVEAAPWPGYAKHSTHRRRTIGKRAVNIESYHPKNTFKVNLSQSQYRTVLDIYNCSLQAFGANGPSISSAAGNSLITSSLKDSALSFIGTLGINADNVAYKSGFTDGSAGYAYIRQTIVRSCHLKIVK